MEEKWLLEHPLPQSPNSLLQNKEEVVTHESFVEPPCRFSKTEQDIEEMGENGEEFDTEKSELWGFVPLVKSRKPQNIEPFKSEPIEQNRSKIEEAKSQI